MLLGEITVTLKSLFWQEPSQPDAYRSAFPLLRSGKHGPQPSPETSPAPIHLFICCIARSLNSGFCGPGRGGGGSELPGRRGGGETLPAAPSCGASGWGKSSCSWSWALSPGKGGHRHTSDTTRASWPATSSQCLQGIACILKENGTVLAWLCTGLLLMLHAGCGGFG